MLNKFKYVWTRFAAKVDGNLATDETDWHELDRTRQKLARFRFKNGKSTTTSNLDISIVRKRIAEEVETDNCITIRKRDRQAIGKWFKGEDLTDTGNFNTDELNSRIEEVKRSKEEFDEHILESYPEMEDTFLAFSKPEDDLFDDDERITLSGVHCKVDPLEELEEEYTLPGIPMFRDEDEAEINNLDYETNFAPEVVDEESMDFSPLEPESHQDGPENPTKEMLLDLENRLAAARRNDNFWVDSGF